MSSEAFEAALLRWLIRGREEAAVGVDQAGLCSWTSAAVVTVAWRPEAMQTGGRGWSRELAEGLVLTCLQGWSARVSGSFAGQTAAGTGLLLVPVYAQAHDTVRALGRFLQEAARALGGQRAAQGWDLRIIGPLSPGTDPEVRQQLERAGWPVS